MFFKYIKFTSLPYSEWYRERVVFTWLEGPWVSCDNLGDGEGSEERNRPDPSTTTPETGQIR